MARRPFHDPTALIRDPADWATDNGWVSRRRAVHFRKRLDNFAEVVLATLGDSDPGAQMWARELRKIGREIAPDETPVQKRYRNQMREAL